MLVVFAGLVVACFGGVALHQQIVVVGASLGNSIASSDMGASWTGRSFRGSSGCATFNEGGSVAFSLQQSLWVATGIKSNGFITCPVPWHIREASCGSAVTDGINWSSCFRPVASPTAIVYGNSVWVVGGNRPEEIGYSSDLISWTKVTGLLEKVNDIAYSNVQNKFVAVGRGRTVGGGPAPFVSTMMYSSNGQNWTKVPSASFIADEGFSVACSVAHIIQYPSGHISHVHDAVTWTTITSHPFNTTSGSRCNAVVFSESLSLWILSGEIFPNSNIARRNHVDNAEYWQRLSSRAWNCCQQQCSSCSHHHHPPRGQRV